MIWVILGLVVLAAFLVPVFLSMDSKHTHKKCVFCRGKIRVEDVKCKHCKKLLVELPEDEPVG